jgi:hypothetical protein
MNGPRSRSAPDSPDQRRHMRRKVLSPSM